MPGKGLFGILRPVARRASQGCEWSGIGVNDKTLPILLPLGAAIIVGIIMATLGIIFILTGRYGAIIIGMAIVVIVPMIGAFLTRSKS